MTPHAMYDVNTDLQSATVFTLVGARALVVSTTHRYANVEASVCQLGAKSSDMAHNIGSYFHAAAYAIADVYLHHRYHHHQQDDDDDTGNDFLVLQFHGMGASACRGVDAYITPGLNHSSPSSYRVTALQHAFLTAAAAAIAKELRQADTLTTPMNGGVQIKDVRSLSVAVPGEEDRPCRMNGVTNVQGRVINGVPAGRECDTAARDTAGHFIHIEQKWMLRLPQFYHVWAQAIRQVV